MRRRLSVTSLFAILAFAVGAQNSDLGNWWIYFGNKQISDKFNWHHELQYRNYNFAGDLEQLLLRTGIGYNLSENNNNVLLGYGYILSQNYIEGTEDKVDIQEHRIYQQFITFQRFEGVSLQHRYRFEQRWIETDFRLRFRYFLSINVRVKQFGDSVKQLYLSAYNEIFLNTEGNVFDRNRLYGGLGMRWSPKVRTELGYMNQFLQEGGLDQLNLVVFFNF